MDIKKEKTMNMIKYWCAGAFMKSYNFLTNNVSIIAIKRMYNNYPDGTTRCNTIPFAIIRPTNAGVWYEKTKK